MRFTFIAEEKKAYPVTVLCRVLAVSPSGFYAWHGRAASPHAVEDARLLEEIIEVHAAARRTYGSPRVHRVLRARGVRVGRHRVARLMRHGGLVGRARRRYCTTTNSRHHDAVAANLLARDFTATAPNQKWVVDTTELTIGSRKGYLAAVLDLYARRLVGWALHPTNDRDLTIAALHQAFAQRQPGTGLVHHSDRGCTYTCADYRAMLDVHNVTASMSGTGNCYDNAVMESWFATLKAELGDTFASHDVADAALFSYIDIFYNRERLHSTLGYVSPETYEHANLASTAAS